MYLIELSRISIFTACLNKDRHCLKQISLEPIIQVSPQNAAKIQFQVAGGKDIEKKLPNFETQA